MVMILVFEELTNFVLMALLEKQVLAPGCHEWLYNTEWK